MKSERSPWDTFVETGKIDDYLLYVGKRKQEMQASSAGGVNQVNAVDDKRSGSAGLQDWRG